MRISSGIDEAGLGPKVGSLFVVGVDVEGEIIGIKESKEVFRRSLSSYKLAEDMVLSVFDSLNLNFNDARSMFSYFFGSCEDFLDNVNIPAFGGEIIPLPFKVINLVPIRVPAKHLRKNRFKKDAEAICRIAHHLKGERIIAGLAGGYKDYSRFLKGWEKVGELVYSRDGRVLMFVKGADKKFGQVALSSIFAKYLREIEMLSLNRLLGFNEPIPKFSGYPSDKNLSALIKTLIDMKLEDFIR